MANKPVESYDATMPSEMYFSKCIDKEKTDKTILQDNLPDDGKDKGTKFLTTNNNQSEKVVIDMQGKIPDLKLPSGWIGVNHESGGIVYLHKDSRVVTWSRPYYLGKNSLRKHRVPVIAIPCLHQLSSLNDVEKQRQNDENKRKVKLWKDNVLQPYKRVKYDSQEDRINGINHDERHTCKATESIDMEMAIESDAQISNNTSDVTFGNDHCREDTASTYPFDKHVSQPGVIDENFVEKSENVKLCSENSLHHPESNLKSSENNEQESIDDMKSRDIADDNDLEQIDPKHLHDYFGRIFSFRSVSKDASMLPIFHDGSAVEQNRAELPEKLKSIPCLQTATDTKQPTTDAVFAAGKTPLAILNEYCQRILKKKLVFVEAAPVGDEFLIEVEIDGIKYGKGQGTSKKVAKHDAARKTLQIIVPEKFSEIADFSFSQKELQVIDDLGIEDPSVATCAKALGLPLPSEILSDCLRRNHIQCPDINLKLTPGVKNEPHTYEVTCGKYTAKGLCESRKTGKQLASQAILKQIHHGLNKWGQIVKIYCDGPTRLVKETNKLTEDKEISRMNNSGSDVLKRLKEEMRKLKSER